MEIWIGAPDDVRTGLAAQAALDITNDAAAWGADGILIASPTRWAQAQQFELACWQAIPYAQDDRSQEHAQNFNHYAALPTTLGNLLEFGCGPYTQTTTIIAEHIPTTITLIDPLITAYRQLPNCPYKSGSIGTYPTVLIDQPGEQFNAPAGYDTVICINVIEHVSNVAQFLLNLTTCLRPDGLLVFHERSWDRLDITKVYDVGHPIRIGKKTIDGLLAPFEQLHKTIVAHEYGDSYYFIGRK